MDLTKILHAYTAQEIDLEEANKQLKEAGANFHLDPNRNCITEEELAATVIGEKPEDVNGWGYLFTGTGYPDKSHVTNGKLVSKINDPEESAAAGAPIRDQIVIGGKTFLVLGDTLIDVPEKGYWDGKD